MGIEVLDCFMTTLMHGVSYIYIQLSLRKPWRPSSLSCFPNLE